ncbi:hypothetical protein NS234_10145 [Microbacterium oxydans]|uniref:uracil-DNA glycosylase family protein n=1 Tax=Microbacterium oxydans TaxID=82380 RepID=UPI00073424B0|nr:uracil-DNA glycosylase family protein [Microbacterium oxydans]KTR76790.1 hypothetical protein NS234_10145 [Microbacterium oxydans]
MTGTHVDLNRLVDHWRRDGEKFVPAFDPAGGGVDARVLVLLESPAHSTIQAGTAAVASEDNPNATARAFKTARIESGLAREAYVRWNIIPWARDTAAPPTIAEIDDARAALHDLLKALPEIRAVVPLGTVALTGVMRYLTLHPDPVLFRTFAAPHPSPANGHRRAERHDRMVKALRHAAR